MNEKQKVALRTIPFLIIGILVFILYLVFFVNIPEMVQVIQKADMLIYLLAAFALILSTFFFSLTWQYLLIPLSVKASLRRVFLFVWVGVFADLLVPAESVSGEIAKAYLMSREPDVNPGKVAASLVGQRIFGTITTTFTLLTCFLGLLIVDYSMSNLMLQILVLMAAVSAFAFAFLVVICIKEEWTEKFVIKILHFVERISKGRFRLEHLQSNILEALRTFYESLRTFGSKPARLIPAILFNILSWLFNIAIVFLVFASIGYLEPDIPTLLFKVTTVYTLVVAIKSIPIGVPAEVGLPDILMTTLFGLFGIPLESISAAATVLTRVLTVWVSFFIGFAAVQWLGVKSLVESGIFGKKTDKV
ncbi:MAG: flippase-like domain-containing protein [Candidatus Bathyarchaeota archaeon]|nr:MAG: flippase-like domain-containing protein [Candidatus Bathyarchaeota archaeon]